MKNIIAHWRVKITAFWQEKGRAIGLGLILLLLATAFSGPDVIAQTRSASGKEKKAPKVKKTKTRNTKKSKSNKVKKVKPRSASGRRNHKNKTVVPTYTQKNPVPAEKKVVPKTASGKVSFKERRVSPRSATGKASYSGRRVSPQGTPTGKRFKDRQVTPRSASGSMGFKNRTVVPRTVTGQLQFKNRGTAIRSISGRRKFSDKRVVPSYTQSKPSYNPNVQVRNTQGRKKYKVVKVTPRSIRSNPRYTGNSNQNRLLTFPLNLSTTFTGNIKKRGRRRPGSNRAGTPSSLEGAKRYNLTRVTARSLGSNPKLRTAGKNGKFSVIPRNTGSVFAGNIRMRGRRPAGNDKGVNPRYSVHGRKKYRVVNVVPRSIPSNPKYRRTANQTKLVSYPKDLSSFYTGNIKSRKGFKHRTSQNKYISYSGNIKMREPKRDRKGINYAGNIKRKNPKYQRLDKSDYLKGRSKAQWASFYRQKTKKQADFSGFQKYKPTREKWMHPSVVYKVGRYKRTVEAKERTRKRRLWLSRMKKNDDQPKYLKVKVKKVKYDPDEIKIWSDYENSRGRAEGKKVKKNDKQAQ